MERINKITEMLRDNPADSFLQHALALEYIKLGNDNDARKLFESLLKAEPGYIGSYYHLAKLLERIGETDEAIKVYEKRQKELKPTYNKSITTISKKLLKATGLADEKENNIYQSPELTRWKKRKTTVMKKLGLV